MADAKTIKKTVKKAVKNSAKKVVKKVVKKTTSLATDLKYEKFCVEYRKNGGNATAAAIAAGYSERTAAQQGARLLRNVKVAARLEELAKDAIRKQIISADKRAMYLSKIVEDDTMDPFARIRAIDILNKMDGLYVFKAEISLKSNAAKTLKVRKAVHL